MTSSLSWAGSSGPARQAVDGVVIHTIGGPWTDCRGGRLSFSGAPGDARQWLLWFERHRYLSIHYVIDAGGIVEPSVPEMQIANHARGANATTIGIELVHPGDGVTAFSPEMINALKDLLFEIAARHGLGAEAIVGHAEIDDRTFDCAGETHKTKMDPGANFPWEAVREGLPRRVAEPAR